MTPLSVDASASSFFDGRYVGFWGAWGTETTIKHVDCSTVGDPAMSAYWLAIGSTLEDSATKATAAGVYASSVANQ